MRPAPMKTVSLLLLLALACGSSEERRDAARARFEAALAAQDAASALAALEDLRDGLPETPESALELVQLLVRAGETNRALWLLEEARQRHPERNDLRLGLAETALGVGDPKRAIAALADISADDGADHAYALLLRAKAELSLGDLEGAL
ncbi:MAG: tetratricopeptide repeat protein, partial [Planctomycetota bacterium]